MKNPVSYVLVFNMEFIKQSAYICKLCVDFSCILSLFLIFSIWTSTCGLFRHQVEFFSRRFFPLILFYIAGLYFPLVSLVFLIIFFQWIIFWASQVVSGKESSCQCSRCQRCGLDPWVGKIPWRKWLPTPIFLPGKFYGQRRLVGYSLWDCQESDMTGATEHALTSWITALLDSDVLTASFIWVSVGLWGEKVQVILSKCHSEKCRGEKYW